MPEREFKIRINGDAGQLLTELNRAQANAQQAGNNMKRALGGGIGQEIIGSSRDLRETVRGLGAASAGSARDITEMIQALSAGSVVAGAAAAGFYLVGKAVEDYNENQKTAAEATKISQEAMKGMSETSARLGEILRNVNDLTSAEGKVEAYGQAFEAQRTSIAKLVDEYNKLTAAANNYTQFGEGVERIKNYWSGNAGAMTSQEKTAAQATELGKNIEEQQKKLARDLKEKQIAAAEEMVAGKIAEPKESAELAARIARETGLTQEAAQKYAEQLRQAQQEAGRLHDYLLKLGETPSKADSLANSFLNSRETGIWGNARTEQAKEVAKQQEKNAADLKRQSEESEREQLRKMKEAEEWKKAARKAADDELKKQANEEEQRIQTQIDARQQKLEKANEEEQRIRDSIQKQKERVGDARIGGLSDITTSLQSAVLRNGPQRQIDLMEQQLEVLKKNQKELEKANKKDREDIQQIRIAVNTGA